MTLDACKRLYVSKKDMYAVEAARLRDELEESYSVEGLSSVRILNRYDVAGLNEAQWASAIWTVFAERPLDDVTEGEQDFADADYVLAVEALPGQYEQREDSAEQALMILTEGERPKVHAARVYLFNGDLSEERRAVIRKRLINPVESREASLLPLSSLNIAYEEAKPVEVLNFFNELDDSGLLGFREDYGLAMSVADLKMARDYFASVKREPTITEIRVLDTYWSDHCRHTTFNTVLDSIEITEAENSDPKSLRMKAHLEASLARYHALREKNHGARIEQKPRTLMDLATMGMRDLKARGLLSQLDESEEINACSIKVSVPTETGDEDYLIMFKNETHNHPTEIEPFGGAATCLGGAIRDPLSGRSYVYQAMRVTGSADPTVPVQETLEGKLPQRTITTTAAAGYSSYGNQIGLATGQVSEIYHPGYVAKRMEVGAVIAATPAADVVREVPEPGDVVILLGGRTGRDGVGGATGSSKKHDESSLTVSGSEVQKGNPLIERNLQRFFRIPEASRMIRRCNDFGAGGVAVAIGELADGIRINLDRVPKKYDGLDGTELAISESQERMACVVAAEDAPAFMHMAELENLEATIVAEITEEAKMVMLWQGDVIVDIDRSFLDTNGAPQSTGAVVVTPNMADVTAVETSDLPFGKQLTERLAKLRFASQKGLVERFDATVGANTVLYPLGGRRQMTPEEGMAARVPLRYGETELTTLMSHAYDPYMSSYSPYHGAYYAVLESISKLVAMGSAPDAIHLTFQEYFPTTSTAEKWGLPLAALLGALDAQLDFETASIGGKDSMSGTFEQLDVPPTLISFAVGTAMSEDVHSATLGEAGRALYFLAVPKNELGLPEIETWRKHLAAVHQLQQDGQIGASATAKAQGVAATVSQMLMGEELGFTYEEGLRQEDLFAAEHGSFILEALTEKAAAALEAIGAMRLGKTTAEPVVRWAGEVLELGTLEQAWTKTLADVFPTESGVESLTDDVPTLSYDQRQTKRGAIRTSKPLVVMPVFPGTNCDYDSERAWLKAGAEVETVLIRNLTAEMLQESLQDLASAIDRAQIIMLAGGFSAGDEPDGSAKFIATVFRNPMVKAAVERFLDERDGLMLGICNGFQALIKLGLLPYGKITDLTEDSPTLTYNNLARHQSLYVETKIASLNSPWMANCELGDIHRLPISHGEGRLVATEEILNDLAAGGQLVAQYVDPNGDPTMDEPYNPNGAAWAVEAMCSADGRILGKMAHSERVGQTLVKNQKGLMDQRLFEAAVAYFR